MYRLFIAESKRVWRNSVRYPIEFFGSILLLFLFLNGVILGHGLIKVGAFVQPSTESLPLLIGFVFYFIAIICLTQTVEDIETEAKTGTLERVFLSVYGPTKVVLVRALVGVAHLATTLFFLISVELLLFPIQAAVELSAIVPVVLYTTCWMGLGLFFGGLALRLKRVRVTLTPIYLLLPLILSVDVSTVAKVSPWIVYSVPIFPSVAIARDYISGATTTGMMVGFAVAWALILFIGGASFFSAQVRRVRRTGSVHEY